MKSDPVASPAAVASYELKSSRKADPSLGDVKEAAAEPSRPAASSIMVVGSSFKTSSLAFREEMRKKLSRGSTKLRHLPGVKEYAELITCNRIELVFATDDSDAVKNFFQSWVPGETRGINPPIYVLKDIDAIAHLFSVASGLDSMVTGEDQILGQVKDAGVKARTMGLSRGSLSPLFDVSVNVGKRVRKAMEPSPSSDRSVGSCAIRFALQRLEQPPRNVLLVGTGKTMRLAASELDGAKLYVATRRTLLSSFPGAKVVSHANLARVAEKCDLIISATKHDGYILRKGELSDKRRVILDLAFPRNIDPALNEGSTEVYNLDDLAQIFSKENPTLMMTESRRAQQSVLSEAERFSRWLLASRQSSALSQVYQWAESVRNEEAEAALRRLSGLSAREKKVVEAMSKRLVSKLLAPPTKFTKSSSPEFPQDQRLDIVSRVFEQGEHE